VRECGDRVRPETRSAIRAARLAQRIADSRDGADVVTFKSGIDVVTAADVACEDAIRTELTRAFPEYPVIGEERGGVPRVDTPYWLVDPICGTRCYASNVPLYCTNIALVEHGDVTVAAIGAGTTGELVYAEQGSGARLVLDCEEAPGRPIAPSTASHTLWIGGRRERVADIWRTMLLADRWYLWTFTSSVCYPYLAAGRIAGLVHLAYDASYTDPPVHTAAGCFVCESAGAIVTDLDTGGTWNLATRSFLAAATPEMHRELREIVAASAHGSS
jgi:myo-inositol-1(or 4)-monophosphatase